ncbi:MAG: hypothetical protein WDO70_09525 [Alphaproteobacteria bacterium]
MRRLFWASLVLLVSFPSHADGGACRQDKRVMAPCRSLQATVSVRANLRPYMRPEGTGKRLALALESNAVDTRYLMPDNLAAVLDVDHNVSGKFEVCPFTVARKGVQQTVCIAKADNLIVRANGVRNTK